MRTLFTQSHPRRRRCNRPSDAERPTPDCAYHGLAIPSQDPLERNRPVKAAG